MPSASRQAVSGSPTTLWGPRFLRWGIWEGIDKSRCRPCRPVECRDDNWPGVCALTAYTNPTVSAALVAQICQCQSPDNSCLHSLILPKFNFNVYYVSMTYKRLLQDSCRSPDLRTHIVPSVFMTRNYILSQYDTIESLTRCTSCDLFTVTDTLLLPTSIIIYPLFS